MAKIIISYHADVTAHDSLNHLYRFVKAALASNHSIMGIFLYQSGVTNASKYITLASDELQVNDVWCKLDKLGVPLSLCITAAEKKGIEVTDSTPFNVTGLAEFAMLSTDADKWVQFK